MEKTIYIKGLYGKEKGEKAPDFVVCKLSAKRQDLIDFLTTLTDEWVNMDVVKGREAGKLSIKLDTWKPSTPRQAPTSQAQTQADIDWNDDGMAKDPIEYPKDDMNPEDIPF